MKLFVGLGNPGRGYAVNRHNVGFMAIDRIASVHGMANWRKRFHGQAVDGMINGQKIVLLKPATYMNESGKAVGAAVRLFKLDLADVVVFYDDIDLAPGKLRVKTGGGNAGHNGLRSITHLVGNDYVRVRIGVGHPGHKDLVADYVLHNFTSSERAAWVDPLLDAIAGASGHLAVADHARFLSDVASTVNPPPAARDGRANTRRRHGNEPQPNEPQPHARSIGADGECSAPSTPSTDRTGSSNREDPRRRKSHGALADKLQKWLKGRAENER